MVETVKNKIKQVLDFLTQRTKTDVHYIAKGNFWLGLGTFVSALNSLVIAVAFGNLVSPEIYGTYRFVLSFYSILALAGLSGFGPATVRAIARGFEGEFRRTFKIQMISSLVGTAVSIGLAGYYYTHQNLTLAFGFIILGAALPFLESLVIYDALLLGRKNFKKSVQYDIITQIVSAIMMVVAIVSGLGVVGLLAVYFFGWVVIRFFIFMYIIRTEKPNELKEEGTIQLGTHLTVMGVLSSIASYLDRIAVFHFLGAAEVAVYSFAIAPGEQMKGMFKNVNTLAMPRFSQRSEEELKNTMLRKMFLMTLVISAAIIAYTLVAPYLFKFFFPKYTSSVFLSQIYVISLLGTISNLPMSAMKALGKINGLYFSNIVSSLLTIVTVIIFTLLYGLFGTVLARVVSRIGGIFINLFALYYFGDGSKKSFDTQISPEINDQPN